MADNIRLTKRVCRELRDAQRAYLRTPAVANALREKDYDAHGRIEQLLKVERCAGTVRGGRVVAKTMFYEREADQELCFTILRDLMIVVLGSCTQMQVRRALKKNITTVDEWLGTSAVESLGRIVQMRSA